MNRLAEVGALFLRLGVTAFGGPAAHIALIERECVARRGWITREQFLDVLGVANLIPGPTSTELAMHVGRARAGWAGLVVAGVAFITPAALLVGLLAAVYVRTGDLPVVRGILAAVQPVVVVIILQALVPIARSALRSVPLAMIAVAAGIIAAAEIIPEIRLLFLVGLAHMLVAWRGGTVVLLVAAASSAVAAQGALMPAAAPDVVAYFLRVGSLLFGSGYVLLPVLHGDLVERFRWLTDRQLLDAVAAGQATPGPVFTTATFIGYLLGGPGMAAAATVAMFLPAFVFSALSALVLDRLRASTAARAFLDGVNAAAVALIAVVLITLARAAFTGALPVALAAGAAVAVFLLRLNSSLVLLAAALVGALSAVV